MMNERRPSSRELKWVAIFSLVVVLITSFPYIRAWMAQGADWVFTGFLIGVEDGNSYIAKMLLGGSGDWLFRSPYSTEVQSGAIVFLPYLLLGKVTLLADQHANLLLIFHLYRVLGVVLLCFATYDFVAFFVRSPVLRKWAVAIAIGGGGLGWVLLLFGRQNWLGSLPLDFYSPESFGFLSVFGIPHLAVSRALLLSGFTAFFRRRDHLAGILWLLMGFFQPVTVVIGWVVFAAYLAAMAFTISREAVWLQEYGWDEWRKDFGRYLRTVLISAPVVVYSTLVFWIDPYLNAWKWAGQNTITSPHPFHYIVAYGFVILLILARIRKMIDGMESKTLFLLTWILIFPFLIYFPVDFQRRLADGIWVVLIVALVKGFESGGFKPSRWLNVGLSIPFVTTLLLWLGAWNAAAVPSKPAFLPSDQVEAFEYLRDNAAKNSIVLSSYQTGNALPAWAPVKVVVGHGPESVNLLSLLDELKEFFDRSVSADRRLAFIESEGISYLFYGPEERSLGDWDPEDSEIVTRIFNSGNYSVYTISDAAE